jgi:hypothetical protein
MKRKLLLAALVAVGALGFNANARVDVTSTYLTNADLSTQNGTWTCEKYTDWQTATDATHVNVIEFWAGSRYTDNKFRISQNVTLRAGYYRIAVNAFYRNGWSGDGTNNNNAWIFAGEKTQNAYALSSGALDSYSTGGIGGSGDLQKASNAFYLGQFSNEFDFSIAEDNTTIEIGFAGQNFTGGSWCIFGPVKLYEYTAADYMADYRTKVDAAKALYSKPMYGDDLAALQDAVVDEEKLTTVDEVQNAINTLSNAITAAEASITAYAASSATFATLKTQVQAIADVKYTETTSGSNAALVSAISTQQTAVDNAANATAVSAAIDALKSAVKTYIAGAEPKNDGEYFDITCLMVNPNFDDSHNGWTYLAAPGVYWSNCEYYEKEFDINQTVTGLPTGSYSLSVQAFQRPGWAGNVWTAYSGGTDDASSVLYINSITSNVKNIMADAQNSPLLDKVEGKNYGVWPYDSQVGSEGSYKYVPNSQQGAKLYFDAGFYDATCAAVVDDAANGSLTLGFKSTKTHVSGDWTIFDNFRLYYYGSSLLVYYKQYLPQLRTEVSADLSNGAYASALTSSEDEALDEALVANPASETEAAYKTVIDNLVAAQADFRAAATSYDAMVAAKAYALTKISANIGTGVFQYNETTNNKLFAAYEKAKAAVDGYEQTTSSTAAGAQELVDALDDAIEAYNNQEINEPADGDVFNVMITTSDDYAFKKNPLTFNADNASGAYFPQGVGVKAHFAQQITFTKVSGNQYTLSMVNADGDRVYVRTNATEKGGNGTANQIRLTTTAANALAVEVVPTSTEGVYNLINTEYSNSKLGCQDDPSKQTTGGIYTTNSHTDFTITAATKPSVTVATKAGKYGTVIFPFTPDVSTGFDDITFYSCASVENGYVQIEEVENPAANTPYIIKNDGESDFSTTLSGYGTATADSYNPSPSLLTGVYTAATIPASEGATTNYVLQTQGGTQAFYLVDEKFTATANKCYLTVTESEAKAFYFNFNDANAIEAITALTSDNIEGIYTVGGAKVNSLQKGINIVKMQNGESRKVFVK